MQVNDRVKPHADFDFNTYHGPSSLEDVGTVVHVEGGWVDVEWDSTGRTSDHEDTTIEGTDTDCGVVPAE